MTKVSVVHLVQSMYMQNNGSTTAEVFCLCLLLQVSTFENKGHAMTKVFVFLYESQCLFIRNKVHTMAKVLVFVHSLTYVHQNKGPAMRPSTFSSFLV